MEIPVLTIPTYETVIPSTKEKITFRPFLVKEQKVLYAALNTEDEVQIKKAAWDLVQKCTEGVKNYDVLSLYDVEYLLLKIRSKSVSEIVDLYFQCGSDSGKKDDQGNSVPCKGRIKKEFNIEDVKPDNVRFPKREILIDAERSIGVVLQYPSFRLVMDKQIKQDDIDQIFDLIADHIESIFEGDNVYTDVSKEAKVKFLESMNSKQFALVENFFNASPMLMHTLHLECPKCGYQQNYVIEGLASFFD